MPKVVLFSTTNRSWCREAKKYFKESRVPFREVNNELMGGEKWMLLFDQIKRLRKSLTL